MLDLRLPHHCRRAIVTATGASTGHELSGGRRDRGNWPVRWRSARCSPGFACGVTGASRHRRRLRSLRRSFWPRARSVRPQTGTIKGRLVWGDDKIPRDQGAGGEGQVGQGSRMSVRRRARSCRASWSSTPRPRGWLTRFAFLVKPKGDSTEQVQGLLAKDAQGRARPEELRVSAVRPAVPQGPDAGDQVERSHQPQRAVHGLQQHRHQSDGRAQRRVRGQDWSPRRGRWSFTAIFIPG